MISHVFPSGFSNIKTYQGGKFKSETDAADRLVCLRMIQYQIYNLNQVSYLFLWWRSPCSGCVKSHSVCGDICHRGHRQGSISSSKQISFLCCVESFHLTVMRRAAAKCACCLDVTASFTPHVRFPLLWTTKHKY
jgi:hypothetical protein